VRLYSDIVNECAVDSTQNQVSVLHASHIRLHITHDRTLPVGFDISVLNQHNIRHASPPLVLPVKNHQGRHLKKIEAEGRERGGAVSSPSGVRAYKNHENACSRYIQCIWLVYGTNLNL